MDSPTTSNLDPGELYSFDFDYRGLMIAVRLDGDLVHGRLISRPMERGYRPRSVASQVLNKGIIKDCVATGTVDCLISDRFVQALTEIGATGWESFPVEVHSPVGLVQLNVLNVYGRCGPLLSADGSDYSYDLHEDPERTYRFIDTDLWDGSDMFMATNNLAKFMRREVVEALKPYKLTGFRPKQERIGPFPPR